MTRSKFLLFVKSLLTATYISNVIKKVQTNIYFGETGTTLREKIWCIKNRAKNQGYCDIKIS